MHVTSKVSLVHDLAVEPSCIALCGDGASSGGMLCSAAGSSSTVPLLRCSSVLILARSSCTFSCSLAFSAMHELHEQLLSTDGREPAATAAATNVAVKSARIGRVA